MLTLSKWCIIWDCFNSTSQTQVRTQKCTFLHFLKVFRMSLGFFVGMACLKDLCIWTSVQKTLLYLTCVIDILNNFGRQIRYCKLYIRFLCVERFLTHTKLFTFLFSRIYLIRKGSTSVVLATWFKYQTFPSPQILKGFHCTVVHGINQWRVCSETFCLGNYKVM